MTVSVVYCELSAHLGSTSSARMVLYENDRCETVIGEIAVTESSPCVDIVGINCSCFVVDRQYFASQTPSERKLWLRTLSNVKVKIQNRAPDPDEEELRHFRAAIRENVAELEAFFDKKTMTGDALLTRCPRRKKQLVRPGDGAMATQAAATAPAATAASPAAAASAAAP
eukprot:CAMPEP_0180621866 /NCGR_PEP_ID=MMETSP1037_2-20121125/35378_1 /TAXON_ID=632150 /ORGANISM="Azadinium spinosum, Strain 3D9" /LENGTH=169 /DNA_ID=CAMNT_0022642073 /DNA_START=307 /DNA_END=812 /DNA_ORIENTATION=-